jgi:hypothetical protein
MAGAAAATTGAGAAGGIAASISCMYWQDLATLLETLTGISEHTCTATLGGKDSTRSLTK